LFDLTEKIYAPGFGKFLGMLQEKFLISRDSLDYLEELANKTNESRHKYRVIDVSVNDVESQLNGAYELIDNLEILHSTSSLGKHSFSYVSNSFAI